MKCSSSSFRIHLCAKDLGYPEPTTSRTTLVGHPWRFAPLACMNVWCWQGVLVTYLFAARHDEARPTNDDATDIMVEGLLTQVTRAMMKGKNGYHYHCIDQPGNNISYIFRSCRYGHRLWQSRVNCPGMVSRNTERMYGILALLAWQVCRHTYHLRNRPGGTAAYGCTKLAVTNLI